MQRAKMTWKMSARHAAGYASPETHLGGSAKVDWKTFRGDHSLLPSPASTGLEFAFGVTASVLRQLERDHATSIGYFEPMTMILDHLAFSPKLSARAVAALGRSSQAFSDDL